MLLPRLSPRCGLLQVARPPGAKAPSKTARPLDVLRHGAVAGRHRGPRAFLGQIVDIGAELFAISATVVYTQTELRDHPERAAETQELAEVFCNQAQHRTERLFHELWDNADASNHRLALDVLKGRHTWLEEGIIDPSAGDGPMVPSTETDHGIPAVALFALTADSSS